MNDVHFAFRLLTKNPGFTAMAVLSLTVGITMNSAIFGIVDGLWLRPMPFSNPDRVVRIFARTSSDEQGGLSFPDHLDLRAQMTSLSGLATVDRRGASLPGEEGPESLRADVVSRNFFDVLGVQPWLGRFFSDADESELKNTPTVVLSHRLWQRRFGGNTNLIGQPIRLNDGSPTVLGIAPPGFDGLERMNPAEVWFPVETWGQDYSRNDRWLSLVGRLKPGYTSRQAQAEAQTVFERLQLKDSASHAPLKARVLTDARYYYELSGSAGLLFLGIAGLALLVTCANVSGLLLARAEVRRGEMAVRVALGGGRWRLVRQMLTESLLLSSLAVVLSLLLAHWVLKAAPAILPPDAGPVGRLAQLDGRVLAFTVAVSLLTVLLFGLAPALQASRFNVLPALKGGLAPRRSGRHRSGLDAVVIGQMAVALVLVNTATLLTRSIVKCYATDVGFEKKDLLLVNLSSGGGEEEGRLFYRQLMERIRSVPGVKHASLAHVVPFSPIHTGISQEVFLSPDQDRTGQASWTVRFNAVDPDYFGLLGIRLRRGRGFTEQDDRSSPRVTVVNERFAQRIWPNEDPVGKSVRLGSATAEPTQVVGVVQDGKLDDVAEAPEPYLYLPRAQKYWNHAVLVVEGRIDLAALGSSIREELRAMDITLERTALGTLKGYLRANLIGRELSVKLSSFFGLLGLGFAAVGLYGVLAHAVARRTQEIGLRMALGAQRRDVLQTILRRGMSLAVLGGAVGLPLAVTVSFLLRSSLFGVRPSDPSSLALSSLLLLGVAFLACYLPGRRAAKVDPMVALRYE